MINVRAKMSQDEYNAFILRKGNRTNREILLEGVGLVADHRPMGPKRFKFDKAPKKRGYKFGKDDLVEEEYQGNAASMTESKRAQMYFSIPEEVWEGLSEAEKEDYISRLPPKKTKAGGEELSDRDALQAEYDKVAQDVADFHADVMKKQTKRIMEG